MGGKGQKSSRLIIVESRGYGFIVHRSKEVEEMTLAWIGGS